MDTLKLEKKAIFKTLCLFIKNFKKYFKKIFSHFKFNFKKIKFYLIKNK